ncbi:hypothetical protein A2U01_0009863, partial [Trifolium medium]|nr:hypothetical protein [Trifolium medium]
VLAANSLDLGWVVVRESNSVLANKSIPLQFLGECNPEFDLLE